jgi:hypothetical protein
MPVLQAPIVSVPPELTDRVIDFLHSDKRTLLTCSLVCKDWVPASRYHYFRKLDINPFTVRRLAEVLNSPVATLARYVDTLKIFIAEWRERPGPHVLDTIAPYLHKFVAVRLLSLCSRVPVWYPIGEKHEESVYKWFTGIKELELSRLLFSSPDDFFDLIGSFHNLKSIRLSIPFPKFLLNLQSTFIPRHLLAIRSSGGRVLHWLLSIAEHISVTKLHLDDILGSDLQTVQHLLRALGPSICTLSLRFSVPDMSTFCLCFQIHPYS